MIVRDADGKIVIINRKDCKNEIVYNEKNYNIQFAYTKKYKSVTINPPKITSKNSSFFLKDSSDD